MPSKKCRNCGGEISSEIEKCPDCGGRSFDPISPLASMGVTPRGLGCLLIVIALLAVAGVLALRR